MTYSPRPLPAIAQQLCEKLKAPPRLIAHLSLVHDAAVEIVEGLRQRFPTLSFDAEAVHFGAATHDLGKVLHSNELTGPGNRHEEHGPGLLERHGVSPELARFARTHGAWSRETLPLEDLLVALADTVWKGQRIEALEAQVVAKIAEKTGFEQWGAFDKLDGLLEEVAAHGDERLAWQQSGK
jgi:HD domain